MKPLWTFTSLVPPARRDTLLAVASFAEIVARLKQGSFEFMEAERRKNTPPKCHRAAFRIYLDEPDYDAFFNSPVGYRAQFCISPENGERRNRELVSAVTESCLACLPSDNRSPIWLIESSLRTVGAKVWINEADLSNLDGVHIDYEPWISKYHAATTGTLREQVARSKAFAGVLAPLGSRLEIKGGWLTPEGIEWHDPSKADRAQEIHDYGFS